MHKVETWPVSTLALAPQVIGDACGSMTTTLVYVGRRGAWQSVDVLPSLQFRVR
jgi:hypothetical protein